MSHDLINITVGHDFPTDVISHLVVERIENSSSERNRVLICREDRDAGNNINAATSSHPTRPYHLSIALLHYLVYLEDIVMPSGMQYAIL